MGSGSISTITGRPSTTTLQTAHAPQTGLFPDFAVAPSGSIASLEPAPPGFLEGPNDGHYSYNAGRVPWRLATDALVNGSDESAAAVRAMIVWIRDATAGDPYGSRAGYTLDGDPLGAYFTSFFAAPFGVAAILDGDAQLWLNDIHDSVRLRSEGYYPDSVTLLSLLVMTGNFWDPTLMGSPDARTRRSSGRVAP